MGEAGGDVTVSQRPIRILHVIDSGGLYGAEAVLLALMVQSEAMGHRPALLSLSDPGIGRKPIEEEALRRGLSFKRLEMGTLPRPGSLSRLLRAIREERVDVVHSHGYKANIIFGLMPRAVRPVPVVCTLHGWCSTGGFSRLRFYEWLDARVLGRHDAVVAVSRRMLDLPAISRRRLRRLRLIPNAAAPLPAGLPAAGNESITDFCRRRFTFGAVGRLSREKGFDDALEALARLRRRGVEAGLLIMGEGAMRGELEALVTEHDLTDRVMMPGYVREAGRCLPLLGAFVLSSLTEGMPISILEAMAAGTPIVSTSVGEVPEMLDGGRAGLLVPPGEPAELARAMERLAGDAGLRERLAGEASRRRASLYSPEGMARAYLELYGEVLGSVAAVQTLREGEGG